jgi:hypothetical protein
VWLEGLGKLKKIISSGLDSVTLRLVAQCLNHYATACPANSFIIIYLHNTNIVLNTICGRLRRVGRHYECTEKTPWITSLAITACPRRRNGASAEVPPRRGRLQQALDTQASASVIGQHRHLKAATTKHTTPTPTPTPQPQHTNKPPTPPQSDSSSPEPRLGSKQTDTHSNTHFSGPLPFAARAVTHF